MFLSNLVFSMAQNPCCSQLLEQDRRGGRGERLYSTPKGAGVGNLNRRKMQTKAKKNLHHKEERRSEDQVSPPAGVFLVQCFAHRSNQTRICEVKARVFNGRNPCCSQLRHSPGTKPSFSTSPRPPPPSRTVSRQLHTARQMTRKGGQ